MKHRATGRQHQANSARNDARLFHLYFFLEYRLLENSLFKLPIGWELRVARVVAI